MAQRERAGTHRYLDLIFTSVCYCHAKLRLALERVKLQQGLSPIQQVDTFRDAVAGPASWHILIDDAT